MPEAARLVWLDEAEAQDPALVGAKAGRLAQAGARGLPVLNGLVVSVGVSGSVIEAGHALLRSTGNSGAARSAVYNHQPPLVLRDLAKRAQTLGDSLVVRSSSRAEAQAIWAGAFSSYVGVSPEEVPRGVIGCWASVFNPDALKRGRLVGISPPEIGMGVLIQPEIRPISGGVATRRGNGTVRVTGGLGHPTGIAAGWETGHTALVAPGGEVQTDSSPLSLRLVRQVADLSRATWEQLGCNHIEWMEGHDRTVHLLQVQPTTEMRPKHRSTVSHDSVVSREPWMRGAARMMIRYPGPVGERYVWPWAIGLEDLSPAPAEPTDQPLAKLAEEVREGVTRLMRERWRGSQVVSKVGQAWSALRHGDSTPIQDLILSYPSVDRNQADAYLRRLRQLGQALTAAGFIAHPGWMWYLDPETLRLPPPGQDSPIRRIGTSFWHTWIYEVTTSLGEVVKGTPAAAGWGVGRLAYIEDAGDAARFSPREVIASSRPVGNLAPLLWNAAGLITLEGSPGAHLFEVAEWLGVPAVCGMDIDGWVDIEQQPPKSDEDLIVTIDGDRGLVTLFPGKQSTSQAHQD